MENSQKRDAEPMICQNVIEVIETCFPAVYLSVIALLQGVALYFAVDGFFKEFRWPLDWVSLDWVFLARYAFVGIAIVSVWHHYMIATIYFRWWPTLLDSLVPFGLGVFEISLILSAPHGGKKWFVSGAVFTVVAALAYLNSLKICPALYRLRMTLEDARRHCGNVRRGQKIAMITAIAHTCFFVLLITEWVPERLSYCVLLLSAIHVWLYERNLSKRVKPAFWRYLSGR